MTTRLRNLIVFGLILWALVVSIYLYPLMPATLVSHWNAQGMPNGTTSKAVALFLLPAIAIVLAALFAVIPRLDPHSENIEKFRGYYNSFIVIFIAFLIYVQFLSIAWNLGLVSALTGYILLGLSVVMYEIGIVMKYAQQNWFIGIRTPWTLSSPSVWNKTHALGGKLFKALGMLLLVIALLQFVMPFFLNISLVVLAAAVIAVAVYLVVYSYVLYHREQGGKK